MPGGFVTFTDAAALVSLQDDAIEVGLLHGTKAKGFGQCCFEEVGRMYR